MSEFYWKVSQLVQYLKLKLDSDTQIQSIFVEGEISNFIKHSSGHMYFSIKDEKSSVRCVMFSSSASKINFPLQNGDSVILQANVSVFESQGQLQLYVQKIQPSGVGTLYLRLEELKKKLFNEGLFEERHKKSIPSYPMSIGLITGENTAAKKDVLTTLARRWPIAKVVSFPTLVQGENAYKQIISSLLNADGEKFDLLLLVRGGGSLEDLWNFNEEELARTIFQLKTPIITGVGHETDTTLVDYVSDKRAATPTAAAELASPNIEDVKVAISQTKERFTQLIQGKINHSVMLLDYQRNNRYFEKPELLFINVKTQMNDLERRLTSWSKIIIQNRIELNNLRLLLPHKAINLSTETGNHLEKYRNTLRQIIDRRLTNEKHRFQQEIQLLDAFSPLHTLKRGYSITKKNNQIISSIENATISDNITTVLSDGVICSKIISKEKKNDE